MLLPYDIRPDGEGWTVYTATTERPASFEDVVLIGLSLDAARRRVLDDMWLGSTSPWGVDCVSMRVVPRRYSTRGPQRAFRLEAALRLRRGVDAGLLSSRQATR